MPGDDIVRGAQFDATRAISIDAPPEKVWPWIAQIGYRRGGFYTYDILDNAGEPSAERVLDEFQDLEVGDLIPMFHESHGLAIAYKVDSFELNKWMVWVHRPHEGEEPDSTWAWQLEGLPAGATRLVTRMKQEYRWRTPRLALFNVILMEFGDFAMERRMLKGIESEQSEAEVPGRSLRTDLLGVKGGADDVVEWELERLGLALDEPDDGALLGVDRGGRLLARAVRPRSGRASPRDARGHPREALRRRPDLRGRIRASEEGAGGRGRAPARPAEEDCLIAGRRRPCDTVPPGVPMSAGRTPLSLLASECDARGAAGTEGASRAPAIRQTTRRDKPMTTMRIRDVDLNVKILGRGYPLLLMHGGPGGDLYTLSSFRQCKDQFTLVFYDHRCNGRSTGAPVTSMTWENLTADADALREKLGFDTWAVLGHSFGGNVALEYALRYPDRLSHLVLLNSGAEGRWSLENASEVLAQRGYSRDIVDLAKRWLNGEVSPKDSFRSLMRLGKAYNPHSGMGTFTRMMLEGAWRSRMRPEALIFAAHHLLPGWSVMDRLGEIGVPTLVMAGKDDFIFPPQHQAELAARIPNARLKLIERAGHNPHDEQPAEVMKELRAFIRPAEGALAA